MRLDDVIILVCTLSVVALMGLTVHYADRAISAEQRLVKQERVINVISRERSDFLFQKEHAFKYILEHCKE